ncbi:hypothetical protein [Arthrobacter sp. MYb227]|nr:hypothetical protein [Arthrobacter sp. MYb227]
MSSSFLHRRDGITVMLDIIFLLTVLAIFGILGLTLQAVEKL